jgi:hypothetical protein
MEYISYLSIREPMNKGKKKVSIKKRKYYLHEKFKCMGKSGYLPPVPISTFSHFLELCAH